MSEDEAQARREQVWQVLKDMHDEPSPWITAAEGWCSPSTAVYLDSTSILDTSGGMLSVAQVPMWRVA
jgi:hypothetical protein